MPTLPSANIDSGSKMETTSQYVVFLLEGQRYALSLPAVQRIVRTVAITLLPDAPPSILGVINVEGAILPVFNLRHRFLLPERETNIDDQLLIATTDRGAVALAIDEALDVIECAQSEMSALDIVIPGLEQVHGVVKIDGDLILIHDLERFLSPDDIQILEKAMGKLN